MNKISTSNKLYELKTSIKNDFLDFNIENMTLTKNKDSNQIVKYKLPSKSNINSSRNFLPKPKIESEKDISKDFLYENHNNYIFLYYETTIEYLKKYHKIYNNISILNKNCNNYKDKSINLEKSKTLSNINANINSNGKYNINNYNYVNNYLLLNKNEFGKFYSNNGMDTIYKNKIRESKINLEINDKKKLIINLNKEKPKDSLNEDKIKNCNLIINKNFPPFKPPTLNDKKEDIKKEENNSNTFQKSSSNTLFGTNICDNIRNEDDEYLVQMFGKRGWICLLCNNFNYETRIKCNRCGELKKPKKINDLRFQIKKEQIDNNLNDNQNKDWICSYCKNINYSFRNICNRCKIQKTSQIINNYNPTINN